MGRARSQAIGAKPPVENQSGSRSVAAQSAVGAGGHSPARSKVGLGAGCFRPWPNDGPGDPRWTAGVREALYLLSLRSPSSTPAKGAPLLDTQCRSTYNL